MVVSEKIVVTGIVFFSLAVPVYVKAHTKEELIFGAWARSQAECTHPELRFSKESLDIVIDADGQLSTFIYRPIQYQMNVQQIVVKLGSHHPYSKTADRKVLHFKLIDYNTIALKKLKGDDTLFLRCVD